MLSSYHKEELIGWVLQRLDWLKVVLVANRADSMDSTLLDAARKQINASSSCIVKQYWCRLSLNFIRDFTSNLIPDADTNKARAVDFVVRWHGTCRALFSDESLSLRTVKRLLEEYQKPKTSASAFVNSLKSVLLPKMPFLGEYCCRKFTQHFCELFEMEKDYNILPEGETSPIRLLVKTGLADVRGELISFPEFASRMKGSHKVHPVVRIAAWVKTIWVSLGFPGDKVLPILGCLSQLQLVDQAKFPFIEGELGATDFSTGEVFSKSGNFTDIMWLADTLNHGHAVNWEEVKQPWETNFISSSREFSHLLSVCPDPEACLNSVAPKNLCILIEGDEGSTIAESCIANCQKEDQDSTTPSSVYLTAAWNLFRNAPQTFQKLGINRLATLLWASQFAFSLTRVKGHPGDCTMRLQEALAEETSALFSSDHPHKVEQIADLWGHLFAGLLTVGTEKGIPKLAAIALSRKVNPIPVEWPEIIKLLAKVEDKSITNSQLEKLLDSGFFSLQIDPTAELTVMIDVHFITKLISLPKRVLGARWQFAILTSRVTFTSMPADIASILEDGLRMLDSSQKITLQGPHSDSLRKVVDGVK